MTPAGWAALFAGLLSATNLASQAIALRRLRRPLQRSVLLDTLPPVTIVRPVRGIEAFSRETAISGLELDYPSYSTIFCVADAQDPIVPLVEELIGIYGADKVRLIIGDVAVSANPKLNNCVRGWEEATTDWVILADSNVLMPKDYIKRMLAAWQPATGLVCSTPAGSRPQSFGAEVECAFLNAFQARWQYVGEALGLGFAQGKSMLWNKPFLDALGGIAALGAEIAEDAAATKLVRGAGKHVHLVGQPFEQPLGPRRLADAVQRQFRWARLRRVTFLPFFMLELISAPLLPAVLAAFGAPALGLPFWLGPLLVLLLWYVGDIVLSASVGWFLNWRTPLAMLVRDIAFPGVWAYAFVGGEVSWRGNAMKIRTDGANELNDTTPTLSTANSKISD
ncbi:ceramide glucosyltransferase [Bosea sp. NBC_00550]|uniref:ceramide glucosyltransferase n=1 Tax=Bosea sp. NBC_00550 TaxID=2969621 RepID=UPI0022312543|nr:ceramide glucosyltransferase [Bosea sp. NBC_00550]UZF92568.1 ceramide glucosyltransferase [Bosea sp. NBC_00550]